MIREKRKDGPTKRRTLDWIWSARRHVNKNSVRLEGFLPALRADAFKNNIKGSEQRMGLPKICVVLLALLLAAMAIVPSMSATSQEESFASDNDNNPITQPENVIDANVALGLASQDLIEKNYVPREVARDQAVEELQEVIYLNKFGAGVTWTGSTLDHTPLIVYDVNGKMLYYKFWVQSEGKIVGEINVAASRTLGSPIQSVSTASPDSLDIDNLYSRAREIISSSFPGHQIISERVVLYDYPATGLMLTVLDKKTEDTVTFVVDQSNYPNYRILDSSDTSNLKEEFGYSNNSRSVYNSISQDERESNIDLWQKENGRINLVREKFDSRSNVKSPASEKSDEFIISALMTGKAVTGTRVLLRNGLYPTVFQGYGYDWCKIGTAHTITAYYYLVGKLMDTGLSVPRARTMQEIATKMEATGTSAPTNPWVEQDYYRDSWSSGGLGMSQFSYQPYSPELSYIQSQINNGDPVKVGTQQEIFTPFGVVPAGHARACYGYDTTGSQPMVYFSDSRLNPPQGQLTYEVYSSSNYNVHIGKP